MTYRKTTNLAHKVVMDQAMLMPTDFQRASESSLYRLNGVADFIWNQIDGQRTFDELVELILGRFSVDRQTAEADLQRFLNKLLELKLIDQVGDGQSP